MAVSNTQICYKRLPAITSFPVHISTGNFQIFRNNFFSTWHAVYFQLCIFCFFPFSLNTFFGLFFSIQKKVKNNYLYFSYLFNLFKCRPYLYAKRTICQHKIFGVNALIFFFFFFATTLQMSSLLLSYMCSVFRTFYCFYSSYNFLDNVL